MSDQDKQVEGDKLAAVDGGGEKIETEKGKSHHMDVGPGVISIDLPCGYIDPDDNLHDTLVVGEMTGYEEDILAGNGPIVPRLNQIISNCTQRFGDLTEKRDIDGAVRMMNAPDRIAALIAIRRVSLGEFYDVKIECPACKEQSRFSLNLAGIDIVRMKEQRVQNRTDTLESGTVIKWHVMSAADEAWLTKRTKRKEDVLTLAMLARVDAVGDNKVEREGKEYKQALNLLKSLSIRERNEIRKLFSEFEGSVDTEIEFDCPVCQHEWKADMDIGQAGFFFPSDM